MVYTPSKVDLPEKVLGLLVDSVVVVVVPAKQVVVVAVITSPSMNIVVLD
jgi:hypothetical protein